MTNIELLEEEFRILMKRMDLYKSVNNVALRKRIYNQLSENIVNGAAKRINNSDYDSAAERLSYLVNTVREWANKPKISIYTGETRWLYTFPGVTEIIAYSGYKPVYGSGFIVEMDYQSGEAFIITNRRLVECADGIYVRFRTAGKPTQDFEATLFSCYKKMDAFECGDVAVLKARIPFGYRTYKNADCTFEPYSLPLRNGGTTNGIQLFCIACNGENGLSFCEGCVTIASTTYCDNERIYKNMIQITLSGDYDNGILFDAYGNVLGLITEREKDFCYAVSSMLIKRATQQALKTEDV